jgi:hypothetical protein
MRTRHGAEFRKLEAAERSRRRASSRLLARGDRRDRGALLPYALHARIAHARGTKTASTTPSRAFARATIASREKKRRSMPHECDSDRRRTVLAATFAPLKEDALSVRAARALEATTRGARTAEGAMMAAIVACIEHGLVRGDVVRRRR